MRVYDTSKIGIFDDKITYNNRPIDVDTIRYAYISGYCSPTEYFDNLNCYTVMLRTRTGNFHLLDTTDKKEAKEVLNKIQKMVSGKKSVKRYNNSLVNLVHLAGIEVDSKKGHKVRLKMSTGRILRVYKSAFELPAKVFASKVNKDLDAFRKKDPARSM